MRDDLKKYLKYFLELAIIIYVLLLFIFKNKCFIDNMNMSVTITLILINLYVEYLWRFNPFSKCPKIYGKYEALIDSTFDHSKTPAKIIIKQNLLTTRIYILTEKSESVSLSSCIEIKKDYSVLSYTYRNNPKPSERDHSPVHYGTCNFKIIDGILANGVYYTDRKTVGEIVNIVKE